LGLDYEYITRAADLGRIANEITRAKAIAVDIETTALDPHDGKIRLFQLALGDPLRPNVYVIDLFQTGGLGPLLDAMRESSAVFVIHNAKFEQKWFWWFFRFQFWPVFCTYRSSAIIYNGKKELKHDLDSVIVRELQEHPENTGQGGSDWSRPNLDKDQIDYAAEDVVRLLRLYPALRRKLADYGLLQTALIEFGVVLPECRTELNGFRLDRDKWLALADENLRNSRRLRDELLYELPHPTGQLGLPGFSPGWNLGSPKQVLASLKRIPGLGKLEDTKEMTLAMKASRHKVIKKILEWRGYNQRVKTFGPNYLRWIRPGTGRIHTEYFAMLAAGRYSSSKPNLQQVPRDSDFRDCFTCPEGRKLILADYAGIEMRLVAEISGDPALIEIFVEGLDAHRMTASVIMEVAVDQVTKAQRQNAKPVNFGFIYGMMPAKFVLYAQANYGVSLSLKESERYHKRYFERYRGVRAWHRKVINDGMRSRMSRTLSGRVRWLDEKAFNEYYNTPVQGSGADALKTSMRLVQDRIDKTFGISAPMTMDGPVAMCHHVHDEIILESDDDKEMEAEASKQLHDGMHEGMSRFLQKVPVVVEPSSGNSWSEAK
jgi:DNA polymerase-1